MKVVNTKNFAIVRLIGMPLTPHVADLCQQSTLCAQLATLYEGIKKSGIANLTLNDNIDMSVLLHTELFEKNTQTHTFLTTISGPPRSLHDKKALLLRDRYLTTPYGNLGFQPGRQPSRLNKGLLDNSISHLDIAPWQSLLHLQEPKDMMKEIDDDKGLLIRFLEIMSPT